MQTNLPKHIVIIPDGNRRWAKEKGMAVWRGHLAGAEKTREQVKAALELGIKCLSWWGGSWGNLTKRSKNEVNNLFRIYEKYFRELIKSKEIYQKKVKVKVIGRWSEILPEKGKRTIKRLVELTKNHNQRKLNFLIAYDGQDEMITAIKNLVKKAGRKRITPALLKEYLWSGNLPPVDFLIRTGSWQDPHNSAGFMMWQTADSQLYFPKKYYPDFGRTEFIKAVQEYQKRQRRMGK